MASSSLASTADLAAAFFAALGREPLDFREPFALPPLSAAALGLAETGLDRGLALLGCDALALELVGGLVLDLALVLVFGAAFDLDAVFFRDRDLVVRGAPVFDVFVLTVLCFDADDGLFRLDLGFWVGVLRLVKSLVSLQGIGGPVGPIVVFLHYLIYVHRSTFSRAMPCNCCTPSKPAMFNGTNEMAAKRGPERGHNDALRRFEIRV